MTISDNASIEQPAVAKRNASDRASQRRHWLTRQRLYVYSGALLLIYILAPGVQILRESWQHQLSFGNNARDYIAFWSASHLALQGHAAHAYSAKVLDAVEKSVLPNLKGTLPWLYPPTFLLFLYPAALLPYEPSAWLFFGLTLIAFVVAINSIVPGKISTLLALAFPGVIISALSGQNGLLTASLMGFGLALLPRRPVWAGVSLGLLCIKPHLAILIPLALICSRSWRTLVVTGSIAVALSAISVGLFGVETLAAFVHSMGEIQGIVISDSKLLPRIPTFFALARQLSMPAAAAYALQAASACLAVASVVYVWSQPAAHELRAATLVCATLAFTPYLYDYDLTWYGLVIAWYGRLGSAHGFRRYEREGLILLGFAPLMGLLVVPRVHFQFLPILTLVTLAVLVTRVGRERCGVNGGISVAFVKEIS
ncbi:glycosyltransferase family 87 protein [Paraburkholderia sp. MM5482-R1]|uniref:glycosyltransferase family 87 protein n=1 Tax=unclassified Paraburkholderia TaxID=2615204 RepID=UPI003D23363D